MDITLTVQLDSDADVAKIANSLAERISELAEYNQDIAGWSFDRETEKQRLLFERKDRLTAAAPDMFLALEGLEDYCRMMANDLNPEIPEHQWTHAACMLALQALADVRNDPAQADPAYGMTLNNVLSDSEDK